MTNRNPVEDRLKNELPRLRSFSMPPNDKERIKQELAAYAELHAVNPQSVPSPFSYTLFPASFWRISGALAALILAVSGSAYASEDALPGDALYSVKVSIAEPIQTALIPDARGKAAWHAILAERRLDEATKLAVAGTLTSNTEEFLTANFSSHVEDSIAAADQLQSKGDIAGSLNVRSDLEARITAHEDILGQVVNHLAEANAATNKDTAAQAMLAIVAQKQDAVEGGRLALQDSLTASADASDAAASEPTGPTTGIGTKVAVVTTSFGVAHLPMHAAVPAAAAQIQTTAAARTMEVASILAKNASLLDSLASTTVATSTVAASTTSSVNTDTKKGTATTSVSAKPTEDK